MCADEKQKEKKLTRSPALASNLYKHVKFLAPPRPCRKTFRGDWKFPLRLRNTLEHNDGTGSSPLRPTHVSPPKSVSTNS